MGILLVSYTGTRVEPILFLPAEYFLRVGFVRKRHRKPVITDPITTIPRCSFYDTSSTWIWNCEMKKKGGSIPYRNKYLFSNNSQQKTQREK